MNSITLSQKTKIIFLPCGLMLVIALLFPQISAAGGDGTATSRWERAANPTAEQAWASRHGKRNIVDSSPWYPPDGAPAIAGEMLAAENRRQGRPESKEKITDNGRIPASRVCSEQHKEAVHPYPSTPKGVVEAFLEEVAPEPSVEARDMGNCLGLFEGGGGYFPSDADIAANRATNVIDLSEPWGYMLDHIYIVTGFRIKKVRTQHRRAWVTVEYDRVGWITVGPMYHAACRGEASAIHPGRPEDGREGLSKDKCRFLHITRDRFRITFELAMPGLGHYQCF